jgi:hypothetical protein
MDDKRRLRIFTCAREPRCQMTDPPRIFQKKNPLEEERLPAVSISDVSPEILAESQRTTSADLAREIQSLTDEVNAESIKRAAERASNLQALETSQLRILEMLTAEHVRLLSAPRPRPRRSPKPPPRPRRPPTGVRGADRARPVGRINRTF